MPHIPHPDETRCCARCKTVPTICGLRFACSCHTEAVARAQITVKQTALRHSIRELWPEEAV